MKYLGKEDRIVELCKGKTVLHLGCVGFADLPTEDRIALAGESLHALLSKIATTKGIDYSRDAIEFFRSHGIFKNVVYGNVEQLDEVDLAEKFDLVVAGDILEHLANPGLMLEGIKRFAQEDTRVLITTPHAFGLLNYIRFVRGRFVEGAEHMMTFNSQNIINLCERLGYTVESIDTCYQKLAMQRAYFKLGRWFFKKFQNWAERCLLSAGSNNAWARSNCENKRSLPSKHCACIYGGTNREAGNQSGHEKHKETRKEDF